jgi:cell division protein FtsL
MMAEKNEHEATEEKMILKHEPIPKYRKIFYIVIIIGVLYLAFIMLTYTGPTGAEVAGGH